jgi:hypothetical protein
MWGKIEPEGYSETARLSSGEQSPSSARRVINPVLQLRGREKVGEMLLVTRDNDVSARRLGCDSLRDNNSDAECLYRNNSAT